MLTRDLMRQVRRVELRARRAVEDPLGGAYRSVFKGVGIAFEEVREYQPGDDIRSIDWNVTARVGHPFVKRYTEERELTVLFLVDVSGSMSFGSDRGQKRAAVAETAGVLSLCAVRNNDRVGLVFCTDVVEKFLPPRKTRRHALRLVRDLFVYLPERRVTELRSGLDFVNRVLRRRALIFVFSDFVSDGYEQALQRTALRHDVIAVKVRDPLEEALPAVGLVRVEDAETGRQRLIDTADPRFRAAMAGRRKEQDDRLRSLARGGRVDVLELDTGGGHLDALVRFFQRRQRSLAQHR